MEEIVRVLRVLEYVGTREWVEQSLKQRTVKGEMCPHPKYPNVIREGFVGEFPELVRHDGNFTPEEASDGTSKD